MKSRGHNPRLDTLISQINIKLEKIKNKFTLSVLTSISVFIDGKYIQTVSSILSSSVFNLMSSHDKSAIKYKKKFTIIDNHKVINTLRRLRK